jgi:hypothetical protein
MTAGKIGRPLATLRLGLQAKQNIAPFGLLVAAIASAQ